METLEGLWDKYSETVINTGLNIVVSILILIVGLWVIKWIVNKLVSVLRKRGIDETLIPTLRGFTKGMLTIMLLIFVVGRMGADTSAFVAVLGALGLAVGFALQGSLANFAGGILILVLKPFKNGDVINVNGETGSVQAISIVTTTLKTPDNRVIYMANGAVAGATITNITQEPTRRWDFVCGIGYDDDFDKAKEIIQGLIAADDRFHKDPAPFVRVGNLGDSSVDITIRAWVDTSEYWNVHFDMIENIKKEMDKAGISIPYPQRDIHVYNEK
ncbi:mechanosensitive ion channel family protein [Roseivirga misakiensis]|uniref:Mechanosensitive ion channel protein MscS n=1 Tax=Roseivirga misakiensis TaxID=1563681 RepID=A0A1E5T516_9BACT|nr:mechanosensitive ion channel domain-containing protein [Roseivirga misakiensis]OEK06464.1 mechanosensitive ion channel protein MscS [Roseivirga misakiensis]